jgi:hypothetical protein
MVNQTMRSVTGHRVLVYGEDYSDAKPGLYLGLFRGRADPREIPNSFGISGPIIGPLYFVPEDDEPRRADSAQLRVLGSLVLYNGIFYEDWAMFNIPEVATC